MTARSANDKEYFAQDRVGHCGPTILPRVVVTEDQPPVVPQHAAAYAEAGRPADAAAAAREAIALARSQGRTDIADRLTARLPQYDAAAASGKQE